MTFVDIGSGTGTLLAMLQERFPHLRAIGMAADGAAGDLEKLSEAIALFRAVGLEDTARRFALQTMILVEEA